MQFFLFIFKLLGSKLGKILGLIVFIILLYMVCRFIFPPSTYFTIWLITTIIVVIGWLLWMGYKHYQSKQQNDKLKTALEESAREEEMSYRPDKRETYQKIRENFEYAIKLLENSKTKESKVAPLYNLPWIMVVGPPSDGKSTAIKNAGIRWPQRPRMDEAGGDIEHEGTGGTRSCNWFFSDQAIILDTSGRWQQRQSKVDEREWHNFLKMTQQFRPKRPINGVVALCSIERLLTGREEAKNCATKIKDQINEIMEMLGTHVPVYLVFNKCDLIHGFIEFYRDLDQETRKQVWGFTRPYKPQLLKSGEGLSSDYDNMLKDMDEELTNLEYILEERRMQRLKDPELFQSERAALCIFPDEFCVINQLVREFVSEIFDDNIYGHNPILRGIYFTSATQVGNPIVELMKKVAGDYDLPLDSLQTSTRETVDAYFLNELFQDVIFKDKNLGGRFKTSLYDRSKKVIISSLAVGTALVGLWIGLSYMVNSQENQKLVEMIENINTSITTNAESIIVLNHLDSLRTGIDQYTKTGSWFGIVNTMLGVHREGTLANAAKDYLRQKVKIYYIDKALKRSEDVLRNYFNYEVLELLESYKTYNYILNTPEKEFISPEVVSNYILRHQFINQLGENIATEEQSKIMFNDLLEFIEEFRIDISDQRKVDDNLINNASRINQDWNWSAVVDQIFSSYFIQNKSVPREIKLDRNEIVKPDGFPYEYTKNGWELTIKDLLDEYDDSFRSDSILHKLIGSKADALNDNILKKEYFKKFKDRWRVYFEDLQFDYNKYSDNKELLFELVRSNRSYPIRKFLFTVANETNISEKEIALYFKDLYKFAGIKNNSLLLDSASAINSLQNNQGDEIPLDIYKTTVEDLTRQLPRISSSKCLSQYNERSRKIDSLENDIMFPSNNSFSKSFLEFLIKPFKEAKRISFNGCVNCFTNQWQEQVYKPFNQKFANSFPFNEHTDDICSIKDIRTFFESGGEINKFAGEFNRASNFISARSSYETAVREAEKIDRYLKSNNQYSLIFDNNTSRITSLQMEKITIQYGDREFIYANGPADTLYLKFPEDYNNISINIELGNNEFANTLNYQGPWAVYRLLKDLIRNESNGEYVLEFSASSLKMGKYKVGIRFVNPDTVKDMINTFENFLLPERIL